MIFICYRREDSSGHAGRLYDRLASHFGESRVFMDVDSIDSGVDFIKVLQDAVASCQIMLVLIGPRWLSGDAAARLDDPRDYVRVEVETALERGVPVVPVLVHGAGLPPEDMLPAPIRPLLRRQALDVRDASFKADATHLTERLERVLATGTAPAVPEVGQRPWRAVCQKVGRVRRRIDVVLTTDAHVLEYVNRMLLANELRLDGGLIGKQGIDLSSETPTVEHYEFPLSDGPEVRTGALDVELSNFGIKQVSLAVDGRALYRGE